MMVPSSQWRRLAVRLARHGAAVMPHARSPWAAAMQRELDYIADDRAALRWALGCVLTSYGARLTERATSRARTAWREVAVGVALLLLVGVALQDNAGGQTVSPPPLTDATTCDLHGLSPEMRPKGATGIARSQDDGEANHFRPDCADRRRPENREAGTSR